ncbi:hypothetical protein [Bradyrhizobium sp. AZCC 1678]|uniref:hypothetical protein n=1 Tax=Bradyrhizobium sp. AZCC 1678 TaxID=3117030 RepID=UPI002FF09398
MIEYANIREYIAALRSNPALAVVSMQMAADFREVSRAAIDRMVRVGRLKEVKIKNTRCVLAGDLVKLTEEFERQVETARDYLREAAAKRSIVFYDPVMKVLGLSRTVPADRTKIGEILGAVSEESFARDKVLLSAIVHRKTAGRTAPGPGFLPLARALGFIWQDDRLFIEQQVERVFDRYAGTARSGGGRGRTRRR